MSLIRWALAVLLCLVLPVTASAGPTAPTQPRLDTQIDVSVVVEGSLPGFKAGELTAYVVQQMNAARVAAWNFEPTTAALSPNRVVWRFRQLPYAGGSVKYIGPIVSHAKYLFGVRRAIGIDARVFIGGQFRSTTFDQATIKGGQDDPDLAEAVRRVARSVIANVVAQRALFRG